MPATITANRSRRHRLVVALAAAGVLGAALAACGGPGSGSPSSPAPAGPTVAASAGAAGAFTAQTVAGENVAVPGLRPSVLFFFSVDCGSCGPGAQALAQAQAQAPQAANFVAVDVASNESDNEIRGFLTDNKVTSLAYARDTNAALISAYQVTQLSTMAVLDASGKVVYRAVDPSAAQIQAELAKVGA